MKYIYMLILLYLGRDEKKIAEIEAYLKAVNMFRNFSDASQDPIYSEVSLYCTTSLFTTFKSCIYLFPHTHQI